MQMGSGSFWDKPKRIASKTDCMTDGVTHFCWATAEKERDSMRSRKMEW